MTPVCEDIYKAIHEGKWLKIEYKNQAEEITNYWIAIKNINPERRSLNVTGMHLGTYEIKDLYVLIDSILTSSIIEGTYCEKNPQLLEDLELNPSKYSGLFDSIVNLKILNYLEMCNRLDSPRYCTEYGLINHLDQDSFRGDIYQLNESQFSKIVKSFSYNNKNNSERTTGIRVKQLAMNVLSVFTPKGLYVLAYRRMNLDVKNKCLRPSEDVTICTEFQIDGTHKENIKYYLDADDYGLLLDFKKNQEQIEDIITRNNGDRVKVDDRPYFIAVGYDIAVDLHAEYKKIIEMYEKNQTTFPIRAFFGDLLEKPRRIKSYPIALINSKINMDQLLAINKAMQYPTAYIQGPPGTGKTNTIINTIITGFFNERTILFASNNNHPIDAVFDKLRMMEYHGRIIPFPVIRLGNQEKLWESIVYIRNIMKAVADVKVFNDTLDKRKGDRTTRAKQLTELLHKYEEYLELKERRETLLKILDYKGEGVHSANLIAFEADLRERQLRKIEEDLKAIQRIDENDALALLDRNEEEFRQYLYFTSAKHIQRLNEEKYSDLR
ncbi:MAG: DNA helicase, partial [Lachnospiraceae bacterium]|nr:DNA helicase [Lachnospiraceae bacterium]